MKIAITCPNINSRHGGIRVIIEWANRLHLIGHTVYIYNQANSKVCDWMTVLCNITTDKHQIKHCDCLIISSPHAADMLNYPVKKKFIFLQMMEHLFNPDNKAFTNKCMQLYRSQYPMFSISKWNIEEMNLLGRKAETHYIGNGVNFNDFPIEYPYKYGNVVLLESPVATNGTKDVDQIAVKVAWQLSKMGYTIKGYGLHKIVCDEFHVKPDLETMNRLYSEATILLKCTLFDARSTSPMEAMTKGCVTVRGIVKGDDDLSNDNSYRCAYDYDDVLAKAIFALNNRNITAQIAQNGYYHIQQYTWDYWINKVNDIICS